MQVCLMDVDRTALIGRRLTMECDCLWDGDHAVASGANTPTEIDIITEEREVRIESAELFKDIASDQHRRSTHCEDITLIIMLALVLLAILQPGPPRAIGGDTDSDLEEVFAIMPTAQFGSGDRYLRPIGDCRHQTCQSILRGCAVIMEDPQPLFFDGRIRID